MASQKSITEIRGTIGNLTFYTRNNKNYVRAKSSLTKEKFYANPNMLIPKKYNQEFAEASTSGKIFRRAISSLLLFAKDTNMVTRFTTAIRKVMNTDTINELGRRTIENGNVSMLKGFDFNIDCSLKSIFFAQYKVSTNREKGILNCVIPSFDSSTMLSAPLSATHFQFKTTLLEIDFKNRIIITKDEKSVLICCNLPSLPINHSHQFTPKSKLPVFLIISIEFYQDIKGEMIVLKNKKFNPCTIISANKV